GELNRLGDVEIKGKLLILISLIIQMSFLLLNTGLLDLKFNYYEMILIISYLFILGALVMNWKVKYIPVVFGGSILNLISFIYNGFNIGITNNAAKIAFSSEIFQLLSQGDIKLFKIIEDGKFYSGGFVPWNRMLVFPSVVSIGDIVIFIGIILVVQNLMISKSRFSRNTVTFSKDLFR
ncbi:MAG: DUF5317 family protein, partial [Tissierellales bacterium]|nr:DUF5317 family protein [Tissierellales bacterium]